uniref:Putative stress-induced protein KIN2-like n=1 Tax=Davidia involucrata TaxID=16924 RepID=A0A5B6YNP0_DAVIN
MFASFIITREFIRVSFNYQFHLARSKTREKAMADRSNLSYQAGEAKGQAQIKKDQMVDNAKNTAQSAKESCQEAGQQMKAKAQGAADSVKDATGMNKQSDSLI